MAYSQKKFSLHFSKMLEYEKIADDNGVSLKRVLYQQPDIDKKLADALIEQYKKSQDRENEVEGLEKAIKPPSRQRNFMFCSHCGEKIFAKAVICPKCGCKTGNNNDDDSNIVFASYIMSVIFPLVGFILGIVLLAKNRIGHGLVNIFLSLFLSTVYWFVYLASLK